MKRFARLLFAVISVFLALESHGQEEPALAPEPATLDEAGKRPFTNNPKGDGLSVPGVTAVIDDVSKDLKTPCTQAIR